MTPQPLSVRTYGNLRVEIYANKEDLGQAAAARAATGIAEAVSARGRANLVFSTGASQFSFVAALRHESIDWPRVHAFHLDEYVGMKADHPASFRLWLQTRINEPFGPGEFYFIEGDAPQTEAECRRYASLLRDNPCDIGFIGIGENGHVAFNDPPVADFEDPKWVKVVELDEACRRQQVGEGWFATIDDVPKYAITQTVPAIMACRTIISVVPENRKAEAVKRAMEGPISTACPASILRRHPRATLFLDQGSAAQLA